MTTTDTAAPAARSSILGGEVSRRGFLALAPRSRLGRQVGAVTVLLAALAILVLHTVVATVLAVAAVVAVWWLVWPGPSQRESRFDRVVRRRRRRRRVRAGLHCYTRTDELQPGSHGAWEAPPAVGWVEPLDLAGTEFAGMFILQHASAGTQYLTVMARSDGLGGGLWTDSQYAPRQEGFGRMLAGGAAPSRWLTGVQQLSRTLPQDLAQHVHFMRGMIAGPDERASDATRAGYRQLVESYDERVRLLSERCEEHASYLIARFEVTGPFLAAAAEYEPGVAGWAKLIRDDLHLLRLAAPEAGLGLLEIYGEQRTVAALRSMQNPDFPPERHGGLHWVDAFRSYTSTDTELVVDPQPDGAGWYTRVATVRPDALLAQRLGPRWLAPILVDLDDDGTGHGSVIRTVSVRMDLIPAKIARQTATRDLTDDRSAELTRAKSGQLDDGTDAALLDASAQRVVDLRPDGGAAGVAAAIFISVQARTKRELDIDCRRIADAADRCGITELDWLPKEQDLAWPSVLPLARGLKASKL